MTIPAADRDTPPDFDEQEVLDLATAGKRAAFMTLVNDHLDALYRYISQEIRDLEARGSVRPGQVTVDDVVERVFTLALRNLSRRPRRIAFRPWLYGIALRVLANTLAALPRPPETEPDVSQEPAQPAGQIPARTPFDMRDWPEAIDTDYEQERVLDVVKDRTVASAEDIAVENFEDEATRQALRDMPPEWRAALMLYVTDNFTIREVAGIVGRPAVAVRQDIERAKQFLRERLSGIEDDVMEINAEGTSERKSQEEVDGNG